jgi:SAM-dependent methyltransferase
MGYRNVHGVDASSPSVETARQIGVRQVELGDALTYLRRYSNYFAVISAQHFLEHFTPEEVLKVLDAVYAALRPRGILIAVVPNAASPFGTYTRYWDPTHELSFSPPSMERLLKAAGFESVRFLEYGPVIHGVKSVLRMTLWQVIRLLLYMYVLAEVGGDRYRVFTRDMRVIAYKA